MNRLAFKSSSEEGDVVLRGCDGQVRIFSQILRVVPYFCAMKNVEGKLKSEHDFTQFTANQLEEFTAYLYGIHPDEYSDSFFEVLDYFQVPVIDINFRSSSNAADLSIKWIIKIIDVQYDPLGEDDWKKLCRNIIKRKQYREHAVIEWLEKVAEECVGFPQRRCTKIKILNALYNKEFTHLHSLLIDYYGNNYFGLFWRFCYKRHSYMKKELFQFLDWVFDVQKGRYCSDDAQQTPTGSMAESDNE